MVAGGEVAPLPLPPHSPRQRRFWGIKQRKKRRTNTTSKTQQSKAKAKANIKKNLTKNNPRNRKVNYPKNHKKTISTSKQKQCKCVWSWLVVVAGGSCAVPYPPAPPRHGAKNTRQAKINKQWHT